MIDTVSLASLNPEHNLITFKMPNSTSFVWKYFSLDKANPTVAKCLLCKKHLTYVKSTSSLAYHLRHCHEDVTYAFLGVYSCKKKKTNQVD